MDVNEGDNRAGEMRWQAERRAAMETSLSYWTAKHKPRQNSTGSTGSCSTSASLSSDAGAGVDVTDDVNAAAAVLPRGSIVWAGLEPAEFVAMFPEWVHRDDVARINVEVSAVELDVLM